MVKDNSAPNYSHLWKKRNDFARYETNLSSVTLKQLNALQGEDEVLLHLLGLNPVSWAEYVALNNRKRGTTPQEECLFKHYTQFLRKKFPTFGKGRSAFNQLSTRLQAAKNLARWNGNFADYVQTLHDNGVLFMPQTYAAFEKMNIPLQYTKDSWAINFYKGFLRRSPTWDLKTAASLYLCQHPTGDGRGFIALGPVGLHGTGSGMALDSNETIVEYDEHGNYSSEMYQALKMDDDRVFADNPIAHAWFILERNVRQHIDEGSISPVNDKSAKNLCFHPKEITIFFREHFPRTFQPQALYIALRINDGIKLSINTRPPKGEIKAERKKVRTNELHVCIGKVIVELKKQSPLFPSSSQVWSALREKVENEDGFECIQSIAFDKAKKEEAIYWRSMGGIEQRMLKSRFLVVVSDFKTRKKALPAFE